MKTILQRIQQAGLTIKLKKCKFGMAECTYLGHKVGRSGVLPEDTKVRAIEEMPVPQTKKQVRSFLGMIGYYRRFVSHFATKADPLVTLTKKGLPEQIQWTPELDQAFKLLKRDLVPRLYSSVPAPDRCFRCRNWSST